MVRVSGIHHLALVTGSLDRTLRFWRDLVGPERLTPEGERKVYPGAGSEYFHGRKK